MAQLSNETKKKLREIAVKQASKIAKEFEEKMAVHYESLIEMYYNEPYKTNPPHYVRTGNLRNSYIPYFEKTNSHIIGGIEISGEEMNDYGRRSKISGEDFLKTYFYTPNGTWHGGNWRGGYGVMADFSVQSEMHDYYKKTVNEFRKKYGL